MKGNTATVSQAQLAKRNWVWLLVLGIIFEIIGLFSLGMMVSVTMASMVFLGVLVLIAAFVQLLDVFRTKTWKAVSWHLLVALLYMVVGVLIIYDPLLASVIITAILAWTFVFIGITRIFMSFSIRGSDGWFWILLAGIASFVLGMMILMQWPISGLWIIGLLISIELIMAGWSYIFLSLAMRKA